MELIGEVFYKSDIQVYKRESKKDLSKQVLGIVLEDKQKLFLEGRPYIQDELTFIRAGHKVRATFIFEGSQRGDKIYNNILLTKIEVV